MELSDFGKIVEQEWFKSFEIRKELYLHEFVIMPNHLHAIVEIYNENRVDTPAPVDKNANAKTTAPVDETAPVETHGRASLHVKNIEHIQPVEPLSLSIKRNPPKRLPKSISSFMAGFKSAVNTKIDDYIDQHQLKIPKYNRYNHFFQPNYNDHIIRNHEEYLKITHYIINNPQNWDKDKFYGTL
jgi:REP element-mobilizing transposase RayT